MSDVEKFVGCRAIKAANYDGEGNNLYSMWLTDEEIVYCNECIRSSELDEETKHGKFECSILYYPDGSKRIVKGKDHCSWGAK